MTTGENQMKSHHRLAPIAGIFGSGTLYAVMVIAILTLYEDGREPFSFFNHFISELGNPLYSPNYNVFNIGLAISGVGFGTFAYCMRGLISTKLAKASVVIAVFAAVLCSGIGIVPSHYGPLHLLIAGSFFVLMTLAMTLYSIAILKDEHRYFPKGIAYYGFAALVALILLVAAPKELMAVQDEQGLAFNRPDIWMVAVAEWLVFFFLTSWVVVVSVYLLWRNGIR